MDSFFQTLFAIVYLTAMALDYWLPIPPDPKLFERYVPIEIALSDPIEEAYGRGCTVLIFGLRPYFTKRLRDEGLSALENATKSRLVQNGLTFKRYDAWTPIFHLMDPLVLPSDFPSIRWSWTSECLNRKPATRAIRERLDQLGRDKSSKDAYYTASLNGSDPSDDLLIILVDEGLLIVAPHVN